MALICASYSQIIALFPSGGGGYVVASRLLSPAAGVVSGSALLIDYLLTIAISVASAMDALFSFLPPEWLAWKLSAAVAGVLVLTLLNLRGVRESVLLWVPVFFVFIGTHGFGIFYGIATHLNVLPQIVSQTTSGVSVAHSQLGWLGVFLLLLRAFSMGAGRAEAGNVAASGYETGYDNIARLTGEKRLADRR